VVTIASGLVVTIHHEGLWPRQALIDHHGMYSPLVRDQIGRLSSIFRIMAACIRSAAGEGCTADASSASIMP
jgi:hypothetical protein